MSMEVMPKGPDYVSMVFLFGGLSLVYFYQNNIKLKIFIQTDQ